MKIKIVTWNVNGIRARQTQFAEWMQSERPDVVCLQELKASAAQVPEPLRELPDYWHYWHGAGGYSGVSLHLRKEIFPEAPQFSHPDFDFENRVVQAQVGDLVFVSAYFPNGGKDFEAKVRFLKAMAAYVREIHDAGLKLFLCGDTNVTRTDQDVHPQERRLVIGQRPDERKLLEAILAEGLVDVGRDLHPDDDRMFTWWAPWRGMRQKNIGWRLDYIMVSETVAQKAVECRVLATVGTSDHGPVMATFDLVI